MDFKKTTRQHADRKYIQMLDGSTPPPYEGDVEIDASRTYSSKRDRYYNRLSQERSEFNSALSKVQSAESARLRSEEADLEKGAKARYKLFKMLKTIAFLLPIVLAVFTGINIFSNKSLYDMVTDAPFVFFWVVFALAMIVASVQLIRKLNQNEIYYNRNHIEGKVKYSALAIGVVVAVTAVGILFISLTSSILPKKDDFVFVNRNGEYYLTGYLGDKSVLVLPNEYEGNEYSIDEMAFYERNDITSVVITGGVKTIGYRAFQWCESIESIKIGEGVTHIQDYAFQYCKALKTLELPSSIEYIGNTVFGDDKLIETAIIPAMVANSISSGSLKTVVINGGTSLPENAFYKATSLENVTIADSVTTISSSAFNGCVAIKNLTCPAHVLTIIPKGSLQVVTITSGDTIPDNALLNAKSLVSVTIPNTITKIGKSAFDGCALLESITVPSGVTEIGEYAFSGCSSVKNIKIPDGITIINKGTFKNCSSLEAITIPESVTAIKGVAFYGCSKITSVVVPNKVTEMGHGVFGKCDALTSITVPFVGFTANPEEARWTTFGYIFGDASDDDRMSSGSSKLNTSNTSEYTYQNGYHFLIPESLKKVTITNQSIVRDYAFSYCDLIEEIIYEKTITSIGTQAFFNCKKLKAIPEFDVSTIANEAFYGCSSLKSITISDKVTSIGASAFGACSGLESLTVPFVGASNSETSASTTTLFGYFFGTSSYDGGIKTTQCYKSSYGSVYYYIPSSLKTVTVTGGKLFYGAFYNCSNLKKVTLGDKIDEIGEKVFYGCSSLEELTTPYIGKTLMASEGASSTTVLGYFFGTSSFTNATEVDQNFETYYIPNSLKKVNITKGTYVEVYGNDGDSYYYPTTMSKILSHTFAGCTSLESVTLPDELEMIGNYAFNGCTGLTEITIPDSVTLIGDRAFGNCNNIRSLTIGSSVTSIGNYAFAEAWALETINSNATNMNDLSNNNYVFAHAASKPDDGYYNGYLSFSITVNVGKNVTKIPAYLFCPYPGNVEGIGSPTVKKVIFEDGSVCEKINDYAFAYCGSLEEINIPETVTWIGSNAFYACTSLDEITIPNGVTAISNSMFANCSNLSSVSGGNSIITIGESAFRGCAALNSITIPNTVTTIGKLAFDGCSFEKVEIYDLGAWCNISFASTNSNPLNYAKNLYLNGNLATVLEIPHTVVTIKSNLFSGCDTIKTVIIPSSVTSIGISA
ncbi:MAG: leucine-rich repeat domain-containing protein, partial [Clostridia bacterium]|nr:leucine-rich repeat domain-containing protein [Clostridia bacterium]